ncbi:kynurenine 3-monooxygenase [Apiospora arundinis]
MATGLPPRASWKSAARASSLTTWAPLVVHQDGTISRIGNWGEMSEFERENTLRIIGKRNQQRLKKLREEGGNSAGVAAAAAATNADEPGKQQ